MPLLVFLWRGWGFHALMLSLLIIFSSLIGFIGVGWGGAFDVFFYFMGPSWSWSCGKWIYNYLCKRWLSPLTFWVPNTLSRSVLDTTLCDKVCQWFVVDRWFSLDTPVSSTNKNLPPRYNWNIVESGVKQYNPNPLFHFNKYI